MRKLSCYESRSAAGSEGMQEICSQERFVAGRLVPTTLCDRKFTTIVST